MNTQLNSFTENLSDIPPVPMIAWDNINSEITRMRSIKKAIISVAAMLILSFAITGYFKLQEQVILTASSEEFSQEIINELQIIDDFFSGESIDKQIDEYALVTYDY